MYTSNRPLQINKPRTERINEILESKILPAKLK